MFAVHAARVSYSTVYSGLFECNEHNPL